MLGVKSVAKFPLTSVICSVSFKGHSYDYKYFNCCGEKLVLEIFLLSTNGPSQIHYTLMGSGSDLTRENSGNLMGNREWSGIQNTPIFNCHREGCLRQA